MRNRHGLTRDIPAPIRRDVRQRCGYGCVLCGRAIVQYHHFDPPFADATAHEKRGITLLCGACHDKEKRGLIGPATVVKGDANPVGKRKGFAHDDLLFLQRDPWISLGGTRYFCRYPLVVNRRVFIGFDNPESAEAPLRLTARLLNQRGEATLEIVQNELRIMADNSDAVVCADRIELRRAGEVALRLRHNSDTGLNIDYLEMSVEGYLFRVRPGCVETISPNGGRASLSAGSVRADVGFKLHHGRIICGATLPFLDDAIKRFKPLNELEQALAASKDDSISRRHFSETLLQSRVVVARLSEPEGSKWRLAALDVSVINQRFLAMGTTASRLAPLVPQLGKNVAMLEMDFGDVLRGMDHSNGIWMNPVDEINMQMSSSQVAALRLRLEAK